ncbi:hypothetical protein HMPREF9973_13350 [Staphylococcus epidermidis NIH05001]|nr:hypothetical protein HMPREF9973_13350 [Staphylococcus epidermidis NIH05001]
MLKLYYKFNFATEPIFVCLLNILVSLATVFEEETTNLFAKIKDKNKEENH